MADDHAGKVKVGRGRWVSRQRAWQLKMKEQGLCMRCGKQPSAGATLCDFHKQALKDRRTRKIGERNMGDKPEKEKAKKAETRTKRSYSKREQVGKSAA